MCANIKWRKRMKAGILQDMWRHVLNLITGGGKEENYVVSSVKNEGVLSDAYHSVEREIDSLRQYDRGEKHIDAPDLRSAVRNIR